MKILLLEDEKILADLLAREISSIPGIQALNVAHSVQGGLQCIEHYEPDLCIVDLLMPDGNGIEVVEQVIAHRKSARIVILTGQSEQLICSRMIHQSIIAVIEKTEAVDALLKIIRLEVRKTPHPPASRESAVRNRKPAGEAAMGTGKAGRLTEREQEILNLIGRGFSMTAVADHLNISVLTARTHRRNIISKLGISGSRLVVYAAQQLSEDDRHSG